MCPTASVFQETKIVFQTQANILACGSEEDCDRVLEMGEFGAADIESRVSRSACYNRVFSSSIACTGK